jgi:dipeptidyl aminopeptidase/acylaminoacyl peptidase
VDYLATREELDIERLAYYGYSFGGVNLATMVVMEPRFKAAIAYIGGFSRLRTLPEVDDISYVHRLTLPLLMLNGTLDPARPIEERVVPFYDLAGTEDEHKKLVLDQGGHFVPRTTLVRESLDWLDRYLGPVR